jgi:hypothetical protein
MTDDLFRPTIEARPTVESPPWRPASIVYPAFFGGPLAGMVLGLVNGRRLDLGGRAMLAIGAAGVAAIIGRTIVTAVLDGQVSARFIGAAAGALVWGVIVTLQKRPFRVYELTGGEPARLIGPGFAAAIGCGLAEAILLVLVLS